MIEILGKMLEMKANQSNKNKKDMAKHQTTRLMSGKKNTRNGNNVKVIFRSYINK